MEDKKASTLDEKIQSLEIQRDNAIAAFNQCVGAITVLKELKKEQVGSKDSINETIK